MIGKKELQRLQNPKFFKHPILFAFNYLKKDSRIFWLFCGLK